MGGGGDIAAPERTDSNTTTERGKTPTTEEGSPLGESKYFPVDDGSGNVVPGDRAGGMNRVSRRTQEKVPIGLGKPSRYCQKDRGSTNCKGKE